MNDKPNRYFDYAATTPLRPDVLAVMMPFLQNDFGNPSSIFYSQGKAAQKAIKHARYQIAEAINAKPEEIFFTGGGTESDNWAIKGAAEALRAKGKHIITTQTEHHAVLYTAKYMEKQGYDVTFLPVDPEGFVSPQQVENAIRPDTILMSVMLANNEAGTIQPLAEIGAVTKKHKVLLHSDAVQAAGSIPINAEDMQVDLLSLSAHKFYGPKGVGALYIRKGTPIHPLLHGGAQEDKHRAGTENVAGIVGMGEALTLAVRDMDKESARLKNLRDKLIRCILETISHTQLNGPRDANRLPGNVNISFAYAEAEALTQILDMHGYAVSTGSACATGEPSHVLTAMGIPPHLVNCAMRFSLGRGSTESDIDALIYNLTQIVKKMRDISSPDLV